jgi:integrase
LECRGFELRHLRLENVGLVDRKLIIGKSKTDAGYREIPLNGAALWGCAKLLERANALGSIEPDHYLFPGFKFKHTMEANRGTGYDPLKPQRGWRSAWRSLRIEAAKRAAEGIEDEAARKKAMAPFIGLRFHDLRHTAITKLAEGEASDQTIMSIAGHLDPKMLEHYSHVRERAKRRAVESISSYHPEENRSVPVITRVQ